MAHSHSVYDTDAHFQVNKATRMISNVSSSKITLIQYDHNSERFTFEMPRYIEGHDMMNCNEVEIHYLNVASNRAEQTEGVYTVDDLEYCTDDESLIIFTWLVSQNATRYVGSLNFILRFVCRTGETVDYVWNTAIYSGVAISNGMYNGDVIVEEYADILAQWEARLEALEGNSFTVSDTYDATSGEAISGKGVADALNQTYQNIKGNLMPTATTAGNDKIMQVVDGVATWVAVANSAVAAYVDECISEALGNIPAAEDASF